MNHASVRDTVTFEPADADHMRRAIELARRGEGFVEPNPMVGCVIARGARILAEGYHQRFGGPHAEVEALSAIASTSDLIGATAYVTLEPCSHIGKTPPCADALIAAKVGRVVIAMGDPFPQVAGEGIQKLRDAGIRVEVGLLENQARELNRPYLKRVQQGIPWVIAKWAMTTDGRIATRTGESQWITGPSARDEVHRLRSRVDAVVVGMGTVRSDNPMLTARTKDSKPLPRIAKRVVFCRNNTPDEDSNLAKSVSDYPTLLFVSPAIEQSRMRRLRSLGFQVIELGVSDQTEMVTKALNHLGDAGMTNLMVEGGGELLGSFEREIDECHVYVGAKRFGGFTAPGPIGGEGIASVGDAVKMSLVSVDQFEDDVRMIYRRS